jgi:hypothetical protein
METGGEIEAAIAIEIPPRDGHRKQSYPDVLGGSEGAIAAAQ